MIPVILSGGSGTRLWPLSRKMFPKQFLPLSGDKTMLQETISRLDGLEMMQPMVVCNQHHRFIVAEQLQEINQSKADILLEPIGRNTAPAIAVAALHALAKGDDPLLLVLAADHVIGNQSSFHEAIKAAEVLANQGNLVTFGIVPTAAETGYGYIQRGDSVGDEGYAVAQFVEKPDSGTATSYVSSGDYYWNSGMFLFKASRFIEELEKYRPDILDACQSTIKKSVTDYDFLRLDEETFNACPSESVDYAVMEQTDAAVVVPLDAQWNDIGSWSAIWDIDDKDTENNAMHGDVILHGTTGCLVHAESRLVTTVGLEDIVIIETKDAVLVADKARVQEVKEVVDVIRSKDRSEDQHHRVVYRPWGHFDSIEEDDRFKVKRITVKPGAKLSLQMHHHRAEHWVVVSGSAMVTKGEESFLVTENESVYIPIGEVHSLENPGKVPLDIIEVQTGSYLGEDDIVRLDDRYGRKT